MNSQYCVNNVDNGLVTFICISLHTLSGFKTLKNTLYAGNIVVVFPDLSGKELHRQESVGRVLTAREHRWSNG